MRSARLQAQDLSRTNQFVGTLLSKNDVKDLEKPEVPDMSRASHMVNGNGVPFRADPKARFSEPPAPPPQQPLPEKPDVPALKRALTDRPKSGPLNTSPVRQDNMSQIIQLTEALNNAKRDIDSQTARMRELETMLQKEREARELAEDLAKRLEESAHTAHMNGTVVVPELADTTSEKSNEIIIPSENPEVDVSPQSAENSAAEETAKLLQSRIDTMEDQMRSVQERMEEWKRRCEVAESERDEDRKTLAEMVIQLRAEEAKRTAEQKERRSRSRQRRAETSDMTAADFTSSTQPTQKGVTSVPQSDGSNSVDDTIDDPTLSRANTITPMTSFRGTATQEGHLQAGLPYASALGVVLIGMGVMAYLNGWQPSPSRIDQ